MKNRHLLNTVLQCGMVLLLNTDACFAQGIKNLYLLRVRIDSIVTDYTEGPCGFEPANSWGGDIAHDFCTPVAWGYAVQTDSLACDSIPQGQLSGKTALIRRGGCEFGLKAYHAAQAGAVAVLVANDDAANHGDDCTVPLMGAGIIGTQVTIPALSICRQVADQIDAALQAGKTVEICYRLTRLRVPYAGYHYATPVSQVTEMRNLGFEFVNSEPVPLENLVARADILEPGGHVTTMEYLVPTLAPGTDTLLLFEGYNPPAVEGSFEAVFSTNKYFESRDTLRRIFMHTANTFASDNLNLLLDGGPLFGTDIFDLQYQVGSLAVTGDKGSRALYCTFGIANADTVYVPGNPTANWLPVLLYKADSDGNGLIDIQSDFSDMELVGIGGYEMNGTEQEDELIDVEINDINTNQFGVLLEPNTPYYVSVAYDGLANGSGHLIAFSNSGYVPYRLMPNESGDLLAATPVKFGGVLSYWPDRTVVCRLQLDPFFEDPDTIVATSPLFHPVQMTVSPNPAADYLLLNIQSGYSGSADVAIIDPRGKRLYAQQWPASFGEQIRLDVKDIASGAYVLIVRTAAGVGAKKVMICH